MSWWNRKWQKVGTIWFQGVHESIIFNRTWEERIVVYLFEDGADRRIDAPGQNQKEVLAILNKNSAFYAWYVLKGSATELARDWRVKQDFIASN